MLSNRSKESAAEVQEWSSQGCQISRDFRTCVLPCPTQIPAFQKGRWGENVKTRLLVWDATLFKMTSLQTVDP